MDSLYLGRVHDPLRDEPLIVAPYRRPEQFIGRLSLIVPGISIEWVLRQDMRDMRRFRAIDFDGAQQHHATPKEMLHRLADSLPRYAVMGE